MTHEEHIQELQTFWEPEEGLFWRIREGKFDEVGIATFLGFLRRVDLTRDEMLPRRLVSLLWYVPLFMEWQTERVLEMGGDRAAYATAVALVTSEIERLLGVP